MQTLKELETQALMELYGKLLGELNRRGVVRTHNSPVGDYAEWLVSKQLALTLEHNSQKGYDATDPKSGLRYQIKSRWEHGGEKRNGRQLNVIRNYESKQFDLLVILIFDEYFRVKEAYQLPHELIGRYGSYNKHQNGYLLTAYGEVLRDPAVKNIRHMFD